MILEKFCHQLFEACSDIDSIDKSFSFGGEVLNLHFIGDERLCDFFTKAINHLEQNVWIEGINVWIIDRFSSGMMLPEPPWHWADMDSHGTIATLPNELFYANYQQISNSFTFLDRKNKRGVIWVNDVRELPEWERSFPFRSLLYHCLDADSHLLLHAGSVGTSERGVLLAGRGGSGKSTSTLACLDSPLLYAGDDFMMVDTDSTNLHSLYNVAKLEQDQLKRFPWLRPHVYNKLGEEGEKAQVFLHDCFPKKVINSMPLNAILLPKFTGGVSTTLQPASKADALRALAPSTIALLKTSPSYLQKIRKLVEPLPCYWLMTGTDLKQIPEKIMECLVKTKINFDETKSTC